MSLIAVCVTDTTRGRAGQIFKRRPQKCYLHTKYLFFIHFLFIV